MSSESDMRRLSARQISTQLERFSSATQTPANINAPIRPRNVSVGKGNTWGFADVGREDETMAVDHTSNDDFSTPPKLTSQPADFQQSTPHSERHHITKSQSANLQSTAPLTAVQDHHTNGSRPIPTEQHCTPNGQTGSAKYTRNLPPSRLSTMTAPNLPRFDSNLKKRPASVTVEASNKRRKLLDLILSHSREDHGKFNDLFRDSKNSKNARQILSNSFNDSGVSSTQSSKELPTERENSQISASNGCSVEQFQNARQKQTFHDSSTVIPDNSCVPETSEDIFLDVKSGISWSSASRSRKPVGVLSRSSTFGPIQTGGQPKMYKPRQAPIIAMVAPDLMDWDADYDESNSHLQSLDKPSSEGESRNTPRNRDGRAGTAAPRTVKPLTHKAILDSFVDLTSGLLSNISPEAKANRKILNTLAIPKATANLEKSMITQGSRNETPHISTRRSPTPQVPGYQTPNPRRAATPAASMSLNGKVKSITKWESESELEEDQTPMVEAMRKQQIAASRKKALLLANSTPPNHLKHGHLSGRSSNFQKDAQSYDTYAYCEKAVKWSKRWGRRSNSEYRSGATYSRTPEYPNIFGHRNGAAHSATPAHSANRLLEVIDLSTPDNKPAPHSIPIKERIAPAKKPAPTKERANVSTPRAKKAQNFTVDLVTPKVSNKSKAKAALIQKDPETLRQKQAAAQIIHKEVEIKRVELDNALFGEADTESEKTKAKRLEAEGKKQKEWDELLLQRFMREENARRAAILKRRAQADDEFARSERETKEQEEKRVKRETERKRVETAHELALEERRKMAIAKIQADREAANREAAEKERLKLEADAKAADIKAKAEEFAKLKVKQDIAKRQANSLTAKKINTIEKEPAASIPAPLPARTEKVQREDIFMNVIEDNEDSLFVSDEPRRLDASVAVQQLAANGSASVFKTSSQATLAQLRQETHAHRSEVSRNTKAVLDARINRRAVVAAEKPVMSVAARVPPEVQPQDKPTLTISVKEKASGLESAPMQALQQAAEDVDEEFAWSLRRPASSHATKEQATAVLKKNSEPTQKENQNEDLVFSWSSAGSPDPEVRQNIPRAEESQVSSTPASRSSYFPAIQPAVPNFMNTVQEGEEPQPNSPIFQANLRQLAHQRQQHRKADEAENGKRSIQNLKTEQQRADKLKKATEKRTKQAAEKKRAQVIADADKNGIEITSDAVRAQVEVFMEKRAEDLQKRAHRKAQKLAHGSFSSQEREPAQQSTRAPAPQNPKSKGNSDLALDQALRKKTIFDAERKAKQTAIARERGNTGFLAAAQKTSVAHFETDSDSDDELAAAIRDAFLDLEQDDGAVGNEDEESDGTEDSDESESDSELNEDASDVRIRRESFIHSYRVTEPISLPLAAPARNLSSNNDDSQTKRNSLLPKNILDAPTTTSASMSSPITSRPREIVLVNIYRVMQSRTKGNETTPATLIDNYGLLSDANGRIHFEVAKFRNSGIQIESSLIYKEDCERDRAKMVHSKKKGSATEFFIQIETRMADTLSGYDPELFTPVVGKTIWNVVRTLAMKNATPAPQAARSGFDGEADGDGDIEIIDIDADGDDEDDEATDGAQQAEGNAVSEKGNDEAAKSTEVDQEDIDSLVETDEPELEAAPSQPHNPPSPQSEIEAHHSSPQPTFTILSTCTNLSMANNSACEAMIQLTKPKGFKIDEIQVHTELVRQLRELREACNGDSGYFDAELTSDGDSVPWLEWREVRVYVTEHELVGPLNI